MQLAGQLVAAGLLAAAVAGCMSSGESAAIDASELETTVLQQEDLPPAFMSFDAGPLQAADQPRGESGWKARYRRSGSPSTRGPIVVESRVDRFDDDSATEESLSAVVERLRNDGWSAAASPEIGEEGLAFQQREEAASAVQYYLVAWRYENVVASVTASGFAGKVTLDEVLGLARAQQRRTEAAA
jgi:hypothetical protein